MGITPLLKVICAVRKLSFCIPSDLSDDLLDVSKTTANLCTEALYVVVAIGIREIYLREPKAKSNELNGCFVWLGCLVVFGV